MFKFKGIKLKWLVWGLGLIALAAGIYFTFFQGKGYVETTATIASITEEPGVGDDVEYTVMVGYDVNGTHYEEELGSYSPSYKEGGTVKVKYDPNDPSRVVAAGKGPGIYMIVIGALMVGYEIIAPIVAKKRQKQLEEAAPNRGYLPTEQGESRELYFLTDRGTAKYGHRIEDKDRKVLYEAKVTKFTLTQATGFDFIDHVEGTTTPHLVGHSEASENNSLLLDNYYSFTFDGEDVWDHLRKNGISMQTDLTSKGLLWPVYHIFRDNVEVARAETTGMYPHEEDEAEHKVAGKIATRGYYRIYTDEVHLDLLFVALLALARTESLDAQGGAIHGFIHGRKPTE